MKTGQILLELVVAIGVAMVALMAIAQISIKSLANSNFSVHQSVANGYSIAGMEWIRSQRDVDWTSFLAKSGTTAITYCMNTLAWSTASPCPTINNIYTRTAALTKKTNTQVQAVVTVTWAEGALTHSARQTTIFGRYTQNSFTCTKHAIAIGSAGSDGGFAWIIGGTYGTPADNSNYPTQSILRIFENSTELGPAHSLHADIRTLGLGRFSHWSLTDGSGESIRFSSTDNSNPKTNGRTYTYCIGGL